MFIFRFQAVDEPGFSVAYAEMCTELSKMSVQDPDGKPVNFRVLLIQRCQAEFEKSSDDELNREERVKEIELETDPVSCRFYY